MQSFTLWQHAKIEIPRRAHSISACLRHIYMQWRTQKIFMGGVWFSVIWWSFIFGVHCL